MGEKYRGSVEVTGRPCLTNRHGKLEENDRDCIPRVSRRSLTQCRAEFSAGYLVEFLTASIAARTIEMIVACIVLECLFFARHRSRAFVTDRNTTCLIALHRRDLAENVLDVRGVLFAFVSSHDVLRTCQALETSV